MTTLSAAPTTVDLTLESSDDDLLDDLREVTNVLGFGYPTVPAARAAQENLPLVDLAVLAGAFEGYEDYGS